MIGPQQQALTAEYQIVNVLIEKEKSMGLGVVGFAEYLGISASLWVKTRDRKRPLNSLVAAAAGNKFPELESYVLIFLRHELPIRNRKLKISNQ